MASSEGSASEGEIIETTHKANTVSKPHNDPGVDNPSRGFGLDGTSDGRGYYNRDISRSPSPYRHRKRDRSPSPYRHNRTRSPSPYRRDRHSRGHHDRAPQSHKRKASPHRHSSRPEKRYHSDRERGHGRGNHAQNESGRNGARHPDGRADRDGKAEEGQIPYRSNEYQNRPAKTPDRKDDSNGYHVNDNIRSADSNKRTFVNAVEVPRPSKDTQDEKPATVEDESESKAPAAEDKEISEESREERKRRWAEKRKRLAAENAPDLLKQALTNASEATTPNVASPAQPFGDSVSSAAGSPRLDTESVPASPEVMEVDKEEVVHEKTTPPADGPSAANYDPTQDMLDDRIRAEQKAQQGMSAASYDETKSNLIASVPAEDARPKKKKKKEIDMFAFSDEEEDDGEDEEEEEEEETRGRVLDAKLLDNWDDPDGYYKVIPNELVNAGRYRMVKQLGRGVYANVARAEDVKENTGRLVAIKIVRRKEMMREAGKKEMEFCRRLNEGDPRDKKHIVQVLGTFDHKGHYCIVFEHMSKNLRDLLKEETSGHGLSLPAVKTYSRQIFTGLEYLRETEIIHADLKPDNILVSLDKKCVKICDFGTAVNKQDNNDFHVYLVSRFYRAPEIILGMDIDYAIDMWAIGCTIYELWTGKILFPGRSNNQMIKVMMECIDWPTEKFLKKGRDKHIKKMQPDLTGAHFDYGYGKPLQFASAEVDQFGKPVIRIIEKHRMAIRPLKTRVQEAGRGITGNAPTTAELNDFSDLLQACLNWNAEKRIKPKDALNHKFFVKPLLPPRSTGIKPGVPSRTIVSRK